MSSGRAGSVERAQPREPCARGAREPGRPDRELAGAEAQELDERRGEQEGVPGRRPRPAVDIGDKRRALSYTESSLNIAARSRCAAAAARSARACSLRAACFIDR